MVQDCSNCGALIESQAAFCSACGNTVRKTSNCPNCQQEITPEAKFCKNCAFNLAADSSQPQPEKPQNKPVSLISPAGAAFAVICFFLPWTQTSCGDKTIVSTGADLGGAYWFVPFMGIVAIGAYFICRYQNALHVARLFISGSAIVALCFLAHLIYSVYGIKESQFRFGFFGSIIGFALTILGCFFMNRVLVTNEQNLSKEISEAV